MILSIVLPKETRRAMCRQVILVRTRTMNLLTVGEVKNNYLDYQIMDIKVSTTMTLGTYGPYAGADDMSQDALSRRLNLTLA